ncbi:hypothetical protein Poly41_71170 [Novipirellula artificiosorum]|uniref:Uncharacterized protein n=1 Tax=Novipirellula artificiosorum TaxID=2528016 RepID=A0A5C6CFP2_9BACT|nr:hypothetical protein Poly41_71170 [Novipirellula artificiosorum]
MHTSRNRGLPDEETALNLLTYSADHTEAAKRIASRALRKWGQRFMFDDVLTMVASCDVFVCSSKYRITVLVMLIVLS